MRICGRLGEIAIDGELVDARNLGDRLAQLRPDVALGVKQADEQLLVDDPVVGVQIGAGREEDPRGTNLPHHVGEGILQADAPFDLGREAVWARDAVRGLRPGRRRDSRGTASGPAARPRISNERLASAMRTRRNRLALFEPWQ